MNCCVYISPSHRIAMKRTQNSILTRAKPARSTLSRKRMRDSVGCRPNVFPDKAPTPNRSKVHGQPMEDTRCTEKVTAFDISALSYYFILFHTFSYNSPQRTCYKACVLDLI